MAQDHRHECIWRLEDCRPSAELEDPVAMHWLHLAQVLSADIAVAASVRDKIFLKHCIFLHCCSRCAATKKHC